MKYYIVHVKNGRSVVEGYSILITMQNDESCEVVQKLEHTASVYCGEDLCNISYIKELDEEEYTSLLKQSHVTWGEGCILSHKIFAAEDLVLARELSYKNQENEDTELGFEFMGQWITNPFVDATGRFEFESIEEIYKYYSRDAKGRYDAEACGKVYEFFMEILNLN